MPSFVSRRLAPLGVVASLFSLVACSSGADAPSPSTTTDGGAQDAGADASPTGSGGTLDLAGYYAELAVLGCQKSFDCCTGSGDDAIIAHNWQGGLTSRADCPRAVIPSALAAEEKDVAADVADGSVVFHQDLAQACLAATAQLSCDSFFDDPELHTPAACVSLFEGKLALGATCTTSTQCPAGAGCIGPLTGTHTCQTIPKRGERCTGYCPAHLYCDESSASPTCVPQLPEGSTCDLAQLECQGICEAATSTCGPPLPKACEGGAVCSPGDTECAGNGVATCGADGRWGVASACANQACVGGACKGSCAPGTSRCAGDAVQMCDANGDWGAASPCSDQACVNGACVGACVPGSVQCFDNGVETCDANGAWSLPALCTGQTCVNGACEGSCAPGVKCVGNGTSRCDGTGAWTTPIDCGAAACVNGACTGYCAPGTLGCNGAQPQTCTPLGTWKDTGSACVDPAPDCMQGSCTCTGTVCGATCVDEQTDPLNCGACGHSCLGSACQNGLCQPVTLAASQNGINGLAIDGANVYWTDFYSSLVMKVALSGGTPVPLDSVASPRGIAVDATNAYVAGSSLTSIALAGNTVSSLASLTDGGAVAVDAKSIFWTDYGSLKTLPLATSGTPATLWTHTGAILSIALDATNVYWADYDGGTINQLAKAPGGTVKTLASNEVYADGIAVDATSVYWTNVSAGTVKKVPIGGGNVVTLASVGAAGIALDASYVYWTNGQQGTGAVLKMPLAGGTPITLASGLDTPGPIAVDATSVYWANVAANHWTDGTIMKVAK